MINSLKKYCFDEEQGVYGGLAGLFLTIFVSILVFEYLIPKYWSFENYFLVIGIGITISVLTFGIYKNPDYKIVKESRK